MRLTTLLPLLAAVGGVLAGDKKHKCELPARSANPLIPAHIYMTTTQEDILRGIVHSVVLSLKQLEKIKHGKDQMKALKKAKNEWKDIAACVPNPYYRRIGQDTYTNALDSIKHVLKTLVEHKKTAHSPRIKERVHELFMDNLDFIGFINQIYGSEELPQSLSDRPAEVLGQMLQDLHIDVNKPLTFKEDDKPRRD